MSKPRRRRKDRSPKHVPIRERLKDPECRRLLTQAKIVFGVNFRDPTDYSIFFGIATLMRSRDQGRTFTADMISIPVDYDSDDPDVLKQACIDLKGSSSYCLDADHHDTIDPSAN